MKRLLCFLLLACVIASAGSHHKTRREQSGPPGQFDYYLLSLSWSPQYCSNHDDPEQCRGNRPYSFVAHGLWPQFERGWPQACQPSTPVPQNIVDTMLSIMPSPRLIQHEWDTHGTCSGLDQRAYFDLIRRAYGSVKIPVDYSQPHRQVVQTPSQILDHFEAANASFPRDSIRLGCSGRYLSEVRICMKKDLSARPCGADVHDNCRAPELIMRPVR
jgi:ribonuclease T2